MQKKTRKKKLALQELYRREKDVKSTIFIVLLKLTNDLLTVTVLLE
jgi:hypothetical protein